MYRRCFSWIPRIFLNTGRGTLAALALFPLALTLASLSLTGIPVAHATDPAVETLRQTSRAFSSVAKAVSPAVVFIQVSQRVQTRNPAQFNTPWGQGNPFGDEFFRRFFGIPGNPDAHPAPRPRSPQPPTPPGVPRDQTTGQGSGFIVTPDGYIITNNHVVGGADKVTVKLLDGRSFEAQVVGADKQSDVAVIKIDAENLPVLPIGDSDALEVGEWVLAVGNPFGLSHSLTAGIVSAKGRSGVGITDYEDFIQTDAAINPGNSGGPLVDLNGRVVGMNTAIFSRNGGYMGIGFAIPINMVNAIRIQLVDNGSVTRGFLGVSIQSITPELAENFDLPNNHGALVAEVTPGSPADQAGVRPGDVVVGMEGDKVETVAAFRNRVALTTPGTKVRITVMRDGKRKALTVIIGTLDAAALAAADTGNPLGVNVEAVNQETARRYGVSADRGVLITGVDEDGIGARAGLRPGQIIREVNRLRVDTPAAFAEALAAAKGRNSVLLLVLEGRFARFLVVPLE